MSKSHRDSLSKHAGHQDQAKRRLEAASSASDSKSSSGNSASDLAAKAPKRRLEAAADTQPTPAPQNDFDLLEHNLGAQINELKTLIDEINALNPATGRRLQNQSVSEAKNEAAANELAQALAVAAEALKHEILHNSAAIVAKAEDKTQ